MLDVNDLAGQRGSTTLFERLTFGVDAGTATIVTGRNGAGKTTLLRILAGLTLPAAGTIRLNGTTIRAFASALRASVLFIGHAAALKDELTAEENVESLARLAGARPTRDGIRSALEALSLGPQRSLAARVLSAGQRRRVGLARLRLVARPLWILDEPLTALDAAGEQWLATAFDAHLNAGGAAVVATHHPLALAPQRMRSLALGAPG